MASTIAIDIITPDRIAYHAEVRMAIVPTLDGFLGILPRHAPLVTGVHTGVVKVEKEGEPDQLISVGSGIMEVLPDQINLVVSSAELPGEIDVNRALRAKERAEDRLKARQSGTDEQRARAALERAIARLKVVGRI